MTMVRMVGVVAVVGLIAVAWGAAGVSTTGPGVGAGRASDAPVVLLWPKGAPGSEGKTAETKVKVVANGERVLTGVNAPNLTVFVPEKEKATGVGILILPGGGHYQLSVDSEGTNVAAWFAERGVAGFVLTYRLAKEPGSTYTVEGDELADVQRAMRLIRSRAGEWEVDPARLGVMGFSAGGELASLLVKKGDDGNAGAADGVERFGSKPAFQGLMYPGNAKTIVPAKGEPPAFLLCGANDKPEIAEALPEVYLGFKHAGVPVEMHIYAGTGHGFGYRPRSHAAANEWPARFEEWLVTTGFLKISSGAGGGAGTRPGGG